MKANQLIIREIQSSDQDWIKKILYEYWASNYIVRKGEMIDALNLSGYIAQLDKDRVGLLNYIINGNSCEVVTLVSTLPNNGIGSSLLNRLKRKAKEIGCEKLWLITTNNNLHALEFYKKRGFQIIAVYKNALQKSRKLKPEIPLYDKNGILISDEIELEQRFNK